MNLSRQLLCLLVLPLSGIAAERDVVLLGQKEKIPFDEIKARYIAGTAEALLRSATVATKVDSISAVTYKGVRVTEPDGKVIEAHILPGSRDSYMVKIYTKEK